MKQHLGNVASFNVDVISTHCAFRRPYYTSNYQIVLKDHLARKIVIITMVLISDLNAGRVISVLQFRDFSFPFWVSPRVLPFPKFHSTTSCSSPLPSCYFISLFFLCFKSLLRRRRCVRGIFDQCKESISTQHHDNFGNY